MNKKRKLIVKYVDTPEDNITLPENLLVKANEHKQISSMLKNAYKHEFTDSRVDFIDRRVMAQVSEMAAPGFCEKLADTFGFFFCKKKSVILGITATAAIAIIAFSTMFNKSAIAQTSEYESFVIYETDSGDGFVQYFNYNVESEK